MKYWKKHHLHQVIAPRSSQTLCSFLDYWLRVRKSSLRLTTYVSYRTCVTKHIQPTLGQVPLRQITAKRLQSWVSEEHRASTNRVRQAYHILSLALSDAVTWQRLTVNPCMRVKLPAVQHPRHRALTAEQARDLLVAAKEAHLDTFLLLALTTGIRRGDLLALRWQNIDFEQGLLRITHSVIPFPFHPKEHAEYPAGEPEIVPVQRLFALPAHVVEALRRHQQDQEDLRTQARQHWREHHLVFPDVHGNTLAVRALQQRFQQIFQQANLPVPMHLHDLRRSTATILQALEEHPHDAAWEADFLEQDQPLLETGEGG